MIKKLIVCICLLIPTLSISQVIEHRISDDGYARVPLQFPFPYYGSVFTESYMFSNGVVGFLNPSNHWCCTGFDLTTNTGSPFSFAIMPLQTDLLNYNGRFLTEGTTQYQRYKWENISEYGIPNNLNTFSVEIRPSGYIGIDYEKINISPGRPITMGMTGDTSLGEYVQYYHGPGYSSLDTTTNLVSNTGNLCLSNPLSSPVCPGYADAYYAQQCTLNDLYDVSCPGYGVAYLNQQCSLSALYSSSCPGYEVAYLNQQCTANQLYSRQCSGYNEAYALANIVPSSTSNTRTVVSVPQVQVSTSGTVSVATPIVADPVVNEVITRQPVAQTSFSNARAADPVSTNNTTAAKEPPAKQATPAASTSAKAKVEIKMEKVGMVEVPVMAATPLKIEQVPILDLLSKQMVSAVRIKNDDRAYYLMMMGSQKLHEEMINEQWIKR